MATGFLYKDFCYALKSQADDAYFSNQNPSYFYNSVTAPTTLQITKFIPASGSWVLNKQTITYTTGVTVNNWNQATVTPTYFSCSITNDPLTNFQLGTELGTAVMVAMVTVFVIRRMYRGF